MDTIFNNETTTEAQYQKSEVMHTSFKTALGVLLLAVGALFLLPALGVALPVWLFKWEMLFVAAGLFTGIAWMFRGMFWLLLMLTGFALLVNDIFPGKNLGAFGWPVLLIVFGVYFLLRRKKKPAYMAGDGSAWDSADIPATGEDFIEGVAIFGQIRKKPVSKNFRGGEVTAIFGGARIDLSQVDMPHQAELEITTVFGGVQLVIPPHWKVRTETAVIFGGVDDKRIITNDYTSGAQKELILRGEAIFGGIELRSA